MVFVSLIIAAGLGFIPAYIAKNKGYNFWLWWVYGWMLFIVAIIHVQFIPDKGQECTLSVNGENKTNKQVIAEELSKCKELLDDGTLTEEEFSVIKQKLLNFM